MALRHSSGARLPQQSQSTLPFVSSLPPATTFIDRHRALKAIVINPSNFIHYLPIRTTTMASAASTIVPTAPAPSSAQHNAANQSRGGRSGARGGQVPFNSRGGGRGRGGHASRPHDAPQRHGQSQHSPLPSRPAPPRPPADDLGGGGVSGHRSTRDAAPTVGEGEELHKGKAQAEDEDEDVEADVCFICASPVVHNSIAPCNHRTCHICALRLRALYKTRACAHCRVSSIPFHLCITQILI